MKFIDEVPIMVKGGNGGNGCCSFEKRKFLTHLGRPDGGDGGSGGDVILRTDKSLGTLLAFKYKPISKAPKGKHGRGSNRHGKNSSPLVLKVPVGTLVSLFDTGEIIAELTKEGQSCVVARGGAKGRGNARFLSFHERHPHRLLP